MLSILLSYIKVIFWVSFFHIHCENNCFLFIQISCQCLSVVCYYNISHIFLTFCRRTAPALCCMLSYCVSRYSIRESATNRQFVLVMMIHCVNSALSAFLGLMSFNSNLCTIFKCFPNLKSFFISLYLSFPLCIVCCSLCHYNTTL